jgi:hypothetical protein
MPAAQELDEIAHGVLIWQIYDSAVKADLFSTALKTPAGTFLVDPVGLGAAAMQNLGGHPKIAGIVVTNENHERATRWFAERFSVPIYLHADLGSSYTLPRAICLQDQEEIAPGLRAIAIDGAPAGEIALHCEADGGSMVVGDALINFEPYGFGLLPAKYCRDFKLMRQSLPKLLNFTFERMLFAHGTPILLGARARLEQLLAAHP